ncbi:hypothetical protein M5K25_026070 [Dendrobium thyrsiflorum]|uniref:Uncharacterized protein n=1 Tax=Dendrobium thyrsiflorum TaxID=117978 RepID=A0ABD0TWA3_DENTH
MPELITLIAYQFQGLNHLTHKRTVRHFWLDAHRSNGCNLGNAILRVIGAESWIDDFLRSTHLCQERTSPRNKIFLTRWLQHVNRLPPSQKLNKNDAVAVNITLDKKMTCHRIFGSHIAEEKKRENSSVPGILYPKVPITLVEMCSFCSSKAALARPKSETLGLKL